MPPYNFVRDVPRLYRRWGSDLLTKWRVISPTSLKRINVRKKFYNQNFFYRNCIVGRGNPGIINAQELVKTCNHSLFTRFALGTFFLDEVINSIIGLVENTKYQLHKLKTVNNKPEIGEQVEANIVIRLQDILYIDIPNDDLL